VSNRRDAIAGSPTRRLLVINADDFGLSDGVNEGIVAAHQAYVVSSTSLMVDGPAAKKAAELARKNPTLSVGLHFVEPAGVDIDDDSVLERALDAQLERFVAQIGAEPTHLDSHHHVHLTRRRREAFTAVAQRLGVPLRHAAPVAFIGGFYGQWEPGVTDVSHVSRCYLLELVATEATAPITELACHPAADLEGLHSSYAAERLVEFETLTSPGLAAEIAALGVELVSFKDPTATYDASALA
jgi:hypothetical protein